MVTLLWTFYPIPTIVCYIKLPPVSSVSPFARFLNFRINCCSLDGASALTQIMLLLQLFLLLLSNIYFFIQSLSTKSGDNSPKCRYHYQIIICLVHCSFAERVCLCCFKFLTFLQLAQHRCQMLDRTYQAHIAELWSTKPSVRERVRQSVIRAIVASP